MKTTLFAILGALLGFLMGAFYSVGFDIGQWSPDCRLLTLLVMITGSMFGGALGEIDK